MNRHAGPPGPDTGPPPTPEPSYAERARTLVHLARSGTLSTLSRRHSGHPFGSAMPYAPDEHGAPLLLISSMAMHTQNLEADARASLLVTQPGWTEDPLAGGRVTLMGRATRVPNHEQSVVREAYLATQRVAMPAPVEGYVAKRTVQVGLQRRQQLLNVVDHGKQMLAVLVDVAVDEKLSRSVRNIPGVSFVPSARLTASSP